MGMAASQARYLALVARKSNCEYEGQQINQARMALSNQSANLFNQMLTLSVPVPPSTQDFTKIQYSFTDGFNGSTITRWEQLANNPEYNYLVTSHYYADKYTGSLKKLTDPQVQLKQEGAVPTTQTDLVGALNSYTLTQAALDAATKAKNTADSNATAATLVEETARMAKAAADNAVINAGIPTGTTVSTAQTAMITARSNYETKKTAYDTALANAANLDDYDETAAITYTGMTYDNTGNRYTATTPAHVYENFINANLADQRSIATIINDLRLHNVEVPIGTDGETMKLKDAISDTEWSTFYSDIIGVGAQMTDISGYSQNIQSVLSSMYIDDTTNNVAFKRDLRNGVSGSAVNVFKEGTVSTTSASHSTTIAPYEDPTDTANYVPGLYQDYVNAKNIYDLLYAQEVATNEYADAVSELDIALSEQQSANIAFENAQRDFDAAKTYYESLQQPDYIGNSKLTLLAELTDKQAAELRQVVSDMHAQNINTDINDCFDENGNYLGGVYTFDMNGVTYYTTYNSLMDAYASTTEQGSDKIIDGQYKMPYYNATYISTKIETTKQALLETDEEGRFSSIRFEDDSVKYNLNMETITDDDAYADAMNQYYYESEIYDKTIQDINAKTSIIHQQDQQLELRLKQLDTEQNALSNEMEAVQKVVKDNVEKSFKTFGG